MSAALAVGIALGVVLLGLLGTVLGALITGEAKGWLPHVSRRLLRRGARHLPPERADRVEEWEAELAEYEDRPMTMLVIALRIWRDGRAIGREAAPEVQANEESRGSFRPVRPAVDGAAAVVARTIAATRWGLEHVTRLNTNVLVALCLNLVMVGIAAFAIVQVPKVIFPMAGLVLGWVIAGRRFKVPS